MIPAVVLTGLLAAQAEIAVADTPVVVTKPRANLVVPALHNVALMSVMRGVESYLWPDPFSRPQYFAAHYEEAFTRPPIFDARKPAFRWDGDSITINVLGHGVLGSELYMRARQCHLGVAGSLAAAAISSTVWEYVFEGNGVRPSAQDLVFTPLAGLVLGELRFLGYEAAARIARPVTRHVVQAVLDPLGELERVAGAPC